MLHLERTIYWLLICLTILSINLQCCNGEYKNYRVPCKYLTLKIITLYNYLLISLRSAQIMCLTILQVVGNIGSIA